MKLTVLGGCGAWPLVEQACSGYLLEHGSFRLLIDPGYAVLPALLKVCRAADVDAVLVSHGHPDHCADLNPLLRTRVLGDQPRSVLQVFAPKGALDRILTLDQVRSVARAAEVNRLDDGSSLRLGPFTVESTLLPHHIPNVGMRITVGEKVFVYTGDSGDCSDRTALAKDADLLLAEATYPNEVPPAEAPYLSSAAQVARLALEADAELTVLTHLWPGTPVQQALAASRAEGLSTARVATAGAEIDLDTPPVALPARRASPLTRLGFHRTASSPRRAAGNVGPTRLVPRLPQG